MHLVLAYLKSQFFRSSGAPILDPHYRYGKMAAKEKKTAAMCRNHQVTAD